MKFILTHELGRLAKWLRILGFDAIVEPDKPKLVINSLRDDRIILTRDSKMSRFSGVRMARITSDFVEEQLAQMIHELDLQIDRNKLFSLCILCDRQLEDVDKMSVKDKVPEYLFNSQGSFKRCPNCDKIYWQGSHWELVNKFLDKLKKE